MTYAPQPGTAAFRILAWLESEGKTAERNSSQIANAMGIETQGIPALLEPALKSRAVFRRQKDTSRPNTPFWYSLTDHGATHRREFRISPKEWMQRPGSDADVSAGPPASDGAASDGTAVTPGPSQPEAAPDTSAPGSQQVLKAEAARPDATDRETPDTASPGVGPMGAGQPADAGPTSEDQRSGGGGGRPAAAGCTGTDGSPLRGPLPGRHSQDAGVPPGPLHQSAAQQGTNPVRRVGPAASTPAALRPDEQPREVDARFAASIREAMQQQGDQLHPADLAATRRAVHAPSPDVQPLSFRAARYSDGSLATERDGVVVAVYSAAETDAIQRLLGART